MPLTAHMLLGPGINAAMQKANQAQIKHSQLSYCNSRGPNNNVEVKKIKSLGYIGFTQLQRKYLQHLDDM